MQFQGETADITQDVKPTENQNDDSINAKQQSVTSEIPSDKHVNENKLNFSPGFT